MLFSSLYIFIQNFYKCLLQDEQRDDVAPTLFFELGNNAAAWKTGQATDFYYIIIFF